MDFYQFAQTFGFPAACLAVLGFALWKGITYVVTKILQPIADRHITFIDHLEAGQEQRDTTARQQAEALMKLVALEEKQAQQLDEQTAVLKKISGATTVQAKIAVEQKAATDNMNGNP